jgi:hypothetical protein
MKLTSFLSLASLALLAWSTNAQAASGTAIAGGSVSTTYVISKPGAYYLSGERVMSDNTKAIISITSDDVTLDLNGFSLSFANPSTGDASAISAYTSNIEVRNGSILNSPGTAIYFASALQSRVTDLRISNVRTGWAVWLNTGGFVKNTEIFSSANGIRTGPSSTVENCRVVYSQGIAISAADGSIVRTNVVFNAKASGIVVFTESLAENNVVTGANSLNGSNDAGIWLTGGRSTIRNNTVTNCGKYSIRASGAAVAEGNTLRSYATDHIALYNVLETSVYRNNNIKAKTATSGPWTSAGGNVLF